MSCLHRSFVSKRKNFVQRNEKDIQSGVGGGFLTHPAYLALYRKRYFM